MHWLTRWFTREPDPERVEVAGVSEIGQRVELRGRVEPLDLLYCPVTHEPAVVVHYRGLPKLRIENETPFADRGGVVVQQTTTFVLRDKSGAALVEMVPGVDVVEVHQRLLQTYGAALDLDVELICPGDEVRVEGRVRDRAIGGSPHRQDAWGVVVVAESVSLVE
jgi:hypothetical protein